MEKITEILVGRLSLDSADDRRAFLVDKINNEIKPPRMATPDNVNIRAMYVVNNLVNSHGGQFRREDLAKLCELIVDTPVLVGHNRAETPLARNFYAELVPGSARDGNGDLLWLKSYFYWPKSDRQDDLLLKIDSGILKECSISFIYTFPECSVCGEDIRKCPHEPGIEPEAPHFIYGGITQVLETSLVYKGSVKGTYITDKLSAIAMPSITSHTEFTGGVSCRINQALNNLSNNMVAIVPMALSDESIARIKSGPDKIDLCRTIKNGRPYILLRRKMKCGQPDA